MARTRRRSVTGALAVLAVFLSPAASAASQGAIGPTSRGTITISVSIAAPARTVGLTDFALGPAHQADGATLVRSVCFRSAAYGYTVAASGSGPGGTLSLSNGEESIGYRAEWLADAGPAPVQVLGGLAPVTVEAAGTVSDCELPSRSGQLRIALDPAEAGRMQASSPYTGSLVLMLAPL